MRRILVGFDGSDGGRRALDRAVAESRDVAGQITVLSVVNVPLDPDVPRNFGTLDDISAREGAAPGPPPLCRRPAHRGPRPPRGTRDRGGPDLGRRRTGPRDRRDGSPDRRAGDRGRRASPRVSWIAVRLRRGRRRAARGRLRGDPRLSAHRFASLLAAVLLVAAAGCGSNKKSAATTTTTAAADSLFSGAEPGVTFADARTAIRRLYAQHPELRKFVYQDVYYTPASRDQVLAVCRRGGPATNARERETSRVFGCAPLIFFFYSFGRRKHVTESTDVARSLYVYAAGIPGPYDARPQLTSLLRSWGVR